MLPFLLTGSGFVTMGPSDRQGRPSWCPLLHPTSCPPSLASYALHTFVVCFESKLKGAMKEIKDIEERMKEQTAD